MKLICIYVIIAMSLAFLPVTAQKVVYKATYVSTANFIKTKTNKTYPYKGEKERANPTITFGPADRYRIDNSLNLSQYDIHDLKRNCINTVYPHVKTYTPCGVDYKGIAIKEIKENEDTVVMGYHCKKYTVKAEEEPASGVVKIRIYHYYVTSELAYPHPLVPRKFHDGLVTVGDIKGFLLKLDYQESLYYPKKDTYFGEVSYFSVYYKDFSSEPVSEDEIALPYVPKD